MYVDVIAVDCMALIYMSIILFSTLVLTKDKDKSTNLFSSCVIIEMLSLFFDILNYSVEGVDIGFWPHILISSIAYGISGLLIMNFSLYVVMVIREKRQMSNKIIIPSIVFACVQFIIILQGAISGSMFVIEDNRCITKPAVLNVYFVGLLAMLYLLVIICLNYKYIGRNYFIAIISYLVFPCLAIVLMVTCNISDFTYAAASLSLVIVHIVIQNKLMSETRMREQIFKEASYVDYLTGLKNRRAFEETVEKNKKYKNKVAIFCDLNSLKYVNDNLGHSAGDQLITKFSNILQENFPDGKLFRISGDEFVVLLKEPAIKGIDDRMSGFKKNIEEDGRIVAVGYAYGLDEDLMKIVRDAEKYMYRDKAEYYNNTGRDRRG